MLDEPQDAWNASAMPLYTLDAHGKVQAINPALASLLGWQAFASGLPPPARIPDGGLGPATRRLWRVPGSASQVLQVAEQMGQAGVLWGAVVGGSALRPSQGLLQPVESARDAELLGLAHELRGPLNAILGFSDVLLHASEPPLAADALTAATHIAAAGERLLLQLDGVLDLARLRLGRLAMQPTVTVPTAVWLQVEQDLAHELDAKDVVVDTVAPNPGEALGVLLDPLRLHQLMAHLLVWMLRASRAGQRLKVCCEVGEYGCWRWSLRGSCPQGLPVRDGEADPAVWTLCRLLAQRMGATLTADAAEDGEATFMLTWPPAMSR